MKNILITFVLAFLFITNVFAGAINSYVSEGYKIVNEVSKIIPIYQLK